MHEDMVKTENEVRQEEFVLVGSPPPLAFCDETDQLRHTIETLFVPSRERSLMLTKLDEVELWATRAEIRTPPEE